MASPATSHTPLTDILLERIEREGPLTFAAFMEMCLYHPEHGYYTAHIAESRKRDYFTSPDVGPLFGRLLGGQLRELWELLGRPARFDLVECGAGRGRLAGDILEWAAEHAPTFLTALRVTLVETSGPLRQQAAKDLQVYGEQVRCVADLPQEQIIGCVLSNELVDALPVHRVVQRAEGLREIYVAARDGALREAEGGLSTPVLSHYLERYGVPLGVDQLAEVNLRALTWLEQVARALDRGFVVTIDYGYPARELYGAGHPRGTLLAFSGHRAQEEWLARPGEQDLTAHVNFTALEKHGRELGLEILGFITQTQFLLALVQASGLAGEIESMTSEVKKLKLRQQLKQLIHPEGMGEAFKVLVQARGVGQVRLSGLRPL